MTRYEKMMRRSLHWAAEHRRAGDADCEEFAMQRYRRAAKKVADAMEYVFAGHINLSGVAK